MTSKQTYYGLIAVILILLAALIGSTYITFTMLSKHADTLTNLKAKQQALQQQQLDLNQAKKDVTKYSDLLKITKSVVPEDKSQAEAVRQIVAIANENNVDLAAISFPASTLGTRPGGAASPSTTTTPPVTAATGKLSQLTPVKGIPNVYSLAITVQSNKDKPVTFAKFISFLNALERNRRTAQVNTIALTPDEKNRSQLSFTLTLNEYIKP